MLCDYKHVEDVYKRQVPEEPRARVFSGNKEVIYKKILETRPGGERILAHGSMPFPGGMQKDASYPGSFQSSNEYFFQNEHDPAQTWEAVCYADGSCFFERSSPRLRYRKMFCWGCLLYTSRCKRNDGCRRCWPLRWRRC